MKKFKRFGFSDHSDVSLYRTGTMEEVHVDIYSNGKYNLFARIIEKNARFLKSNGRWIVFDKDDNVIIDIVVDDIKNCMSKGQKGICYEVIFSINNINYRIVIYGSKTNKIMCA